jgi:YVTN family beta-propeller protein
LTLHGVPPPCRTRVVLVILFLCWASSAAAQPLGYVLGDRTGTNDLVNGGGIAASPDGSRVYVVNSVDRTVSVISTLTNTVVGTIGTIQIASLPVFATFGIAICADGRRLYATAWTGFCSGQAVKMIDTASGAVVASIGTPPFPGAIALSPDGTTAYVSHIGSSCGLTGVRLLAARVQRATHGLRPESHGHVLRIHPDDGANVERDGGTRDLQPERDGDEPCGRGEATAVQTVAVP